VKDKDVAFLETGYCVVHIVELADIS